MRLPISFLLLFLLSGSAYADIVNGGFETGDLTGWTAGGTGSIQVLTNGQFAASDNSVSINAPAGTYYGLLSNGPYDQGGVPLDTSSLVSSSYTVAPGDHLLFVLDFFTNEFATPFGNPDFYDVSIIDGATTTSVAGGNVDTAQTVFPTVDCISVFLMAPDGTTVCSHSGLQNLNIDLSPFAGHTVQFQFLVSDAVDNNFDSALLLDGVHVSNSPASVPEPQTWTLLLTVIVACAAFLRRRVRVSQPFRGAGR